MKLYLVWNEAKTECVGFVDKAEAILCATGIWRHEEKIQPSLLADHWVMIYDQELCTITEIDIIEKVDFGRKLSKEEVIDCISASGEDECCACGVKWELHHVLCEGSAITEIEV